MKTRCCWCGSGFQKYGEHYWCETAPCRKRQFQHGIAFHDRQTRALKHLFYVPLPKQVEFETATTPMLLGGGAAGASKSHAARYALYRRAFTIPGFEALILRKTWSELEKHHLRLMERETLRLRNLGLQVEFSKTDREMRFKHGGEVSVIEGGHMENPEDVEKYLSRERDAIVCDEGSTFSPQPLLELSTRARSTKPAVAAFARQLHGLHPHIQPPRGGAVFWVLSNPGGPSAAMLRDFCIDHTPNFDDFPQLAGADSEGRSLYDPAEWGYIPGNLEDNPYLPDSYERDLAVLPPWRYQQLRFNNWDVVAGQFFVEFDSRIHVKDLGTPSGASWFRSYDYGYIDPSVCLWWAILPDGRLYLRAELKQQFQNIENICKAIRLKTKELGIRAVRYTVADALSMGMRKSDDEGETRGDSFRHCGVPVIPATHDRAQGWTRLRELFALRSDNLPWLVIHPSCRYLIRCLTAAISSKEDPEDVDKHCDDHPLDAARYGAMSRPAPSRIKGLGLPKNAVGHLLREVQARSNQGAGWHALTK